MAANKLKITILVCLALTAGAWLHFYLRSGSSDSQIDAGKPNSHTPEGVGSETTETTHTGNQPTATASAVDPALRTQLFAEYRCPKESCPPSPFIAENEDEAIWLRARGYPSPAQREEAKRLPTAELKLRAQKGDLVTASLYGERLIEDNDWKGAQAVLLTTIKRGNVYALYALSHWEGNHPEHPDPVEARAMIRLAYLAGDYKSTILLVETFPRFNSALLP
jgi:hypothetical protein